MKKILLVAAVAGLAFTACKKDRVCTCTWTDVSTTVNGVAVPPPTNPSTTTSVDKIEKVTKSGAACNSGERTTTTVSGTVTVVDVSKASCELSK